MNYQYIEQLIERYFDCQTTLEEEQILRSFFQQKDVPEHLSQYTDMFCYEAEAHSESLSNDFDARMLQLVNDEPQQSSRSNVVSMRRMFAPFCKAAAVVAVAITFGTAAEHAIGVQQAEDAATDAGAVAIDPYIKASDIGNALRVKDVNKAEMKMMTDTLMGMPIDNATERQ